MSYIPLMFPVMVTVCMFSLSSVQYSLAQRQLRHRLNNSIVIVAKLKVTIWGELVETPRVTRIGTFGKGSRFVLHSSILKSYIIPMLYVAVNIGPISITSRKSRIAHGSHPLTIKHHFCWPLTVRYKDFGLKLRSAVKVDTPAVSIDNKNARCLTSVRTAFSSFSIFEFIARRFESRTKLLNCRVVLRKKLDVCITLPWQNLVELNSA